MILSRVQPPAPQQSYTHTRRCIYAYIHVSEHGSTNHLQFVDWETGAALKETISHSKLCWRKPWWCLINRLLKLGFEGLLWWKATPVLAAPVINSCAAFALPVCSPSSVHLLEWEGDKNEAVPSGMDATLNFPPKNIFHLKSVYHRNTYWLKAGLIHFQTSVSPNAAVSFFIKLSTAIKYKCWFDSKNFPAAVV